MRAHARLLPIVYTVAMGVLALGVLVVVAASRTQRYSLRRVPPDPLASDGVQRWDQLEGSFRNRARREVLPILTHDPLWPVYVPKSGGGEAPPRPPAAAPEGRARGATSVARQGGIDLLGPAVDAASEAADIAEAARGEHQRRLQAADAVVAVDDGGAVAIELAQPLLELAQRDQEGARQAHERLLPALAHVDELGLLPCIERLVQLVNL